MKSYEELKKELNPDNVFLLEERAAIIEADGKMTREEAEKKAAEGWSDYVIYNRSQRTSKAPEIKNGRGLK